MGLLSGQALKPRGNEKVSFDCAKVTSAAARLICADGDLADDENQLADLYKAKAGSLDKIGQTALRDEQVKWIRQRNRECGLEAKQNVPVEELVAAKPCLDKWINERITALSKPVISDKTTSAPRNPLAAPDITALKHGTYVETATPCSDAPFSRRNVFNGTSFMAGHSCPFQLKDKRGNEVKIASHCDGPDDGADTLTLVFAAKSSTEYVTKNPESGDVFDFRYCSQAELDGTRAASDENTTTPAAQEAPKVQPQVRPLSDPLSFDLLGYKLHAKKPAENYWAETPNSIVIYDKLPIPNDLSQNGTELFGYFTGDHMRPENRIAFGFLLQGLRLGVAFMDNAIAVVEKKFGTPTSIFDPNLMTRTRILTYGISFDELRRYSATVDPQQIIQSIADGYTVLPEPFAVVQVYDVGGDTAIQSIIVDPHLAERNRLVANAIIQRHTIDAKQRERQNLPSPRF